MKLEIRPPVDAIGFSPRHPAYSEAHWAWLAERPLTRVVLQVLYLA